MTYFYLGGTEIISALKWRKRCTLLTNVFFFLYLFVFVLFLSVNGFVLFLNVFFFFFFFFL